jgi:hypothetical protein
MHVVKHTKHTWNPENFIIVMIKSWTLLTIRHLCFKRTAAAIATLGNHSVASYFFLLGVAVVIMTEYNSGARSFISWHILASDSLRISLAVVFLSKDGLLDEIISQHSTDNCFNMHLMSSDLISLINTVYSWRNFLPRPSKEGTA